MDKLPEPVDTSTTTRTYRTLDKGYLEMHRYQGDVNNTMDTTKITLRNHSIQADISCSVKDLGKLIQYLELIKASF